MLLRLSAWTKINFTYLPISTWHRSTSRIVQYLCKNGQIWTISTFVRNLLLKEKFQRSKFFFSMTKKISFQLFLLNLCESLQVRPRINDLWHNTKNLFYLISVGCVLYQLTYKWMWTFSNVSFVFYNSFCHLWKSVNWIGT